MPPSRSLAPFSPWCSKNSPNASEVLWAFSPLDLHCFFIPRHRSQDQIYPSTAKVSRLKRSQWGEKKRRRKESKQSALAHKSSVNQGGAHTINLLLTLLWKYVWRKQPIVVWNVFKYKIMPFVWGEKLEQCEGTKVPCGIYQHPLCSVRFGVSTWRITQAPLNAIVSFFLMTFTGSKHAVNSIRKLHPS